MLCALVIWFDNLHSKAYLLLIDDEDGNEKLRSIDRRDEATPKDEYGGQECNWSS